MGELMLAYRNLDLHSRVAVVAEHLGDSPNRRSFPAGLLQNIDHDHLDASRLRLLALRYQDVMREPFVFRPDDPGSSFIKQSSDRMAVSARENLTTPTVLPPPGPEPVEFTNSAISAAPQL